MFKNTITNLSWVTGLSSIAIAISEWLIGWGEIVSWQLFGEGLSFIYVLGYSHCQASHAPVDDPSPVFIWAALTGLSGLPERGKMSNEVEGSSWGE